jgi:carboxyl-terminal processing protease
MQIPQEQPQPSGVERVARLAVPVFLLLSIVTLAFGLGFLVHDLTSDDAPAAAAPATSSGNNGAVSDTVGAAILNEIYEILRSQYVDRDLISEDRFRRAAIDGIINSLNDPHTDYLSPEDVASGALDLSSTYQGIGASVSDASGQVTIVAPFRDSPAERAGIRAGDIILEVDGVSTDGWSDQQAVQVIRGPAGTEVTLTVLHTDGTIEEITIVRGDILIQSVFLEPPLELIPGESGDMLVDRDGNPVDDIAYVHIAQFHDQTLSELREALAFLADGDYIGLIVDVRSNPGGLLSATVEVVDEFLEEGIILSEKDGQGEERSWNARSGGVASTIPLVVLQDGASASGAEVLSASLRDNDRAVVIGTRSFGKGTVNQVRHLQNCGDPNGCGALYLAVGRWLTPTGKEIEGVGVAPNIELPMSQDDYIEFGDIQIFEAIDVLRGNR